MTTTAKATKAEALRVAKKRYGGTIKAEYKPGRPTEAERQAARQQADELRDKRNAVKAEIHGIGNPLPALADAAQFILDVDGHPDAMKALRKALDTARRHAELTDEYRDLANEIQRTKDIAVSLHRCVVYSVNDWGFDSRRILASADTWEQVIQRLERESQ